MQERLGRDVGTVVIGGGQAGLATAYHLRRRGEDFVVLDAEARVGDQWRRRWDSLRLFTPARFSSLPGLPLRLGPAEYATKDQVADYLEEYADVFARPLHGGVRVTRLERTGESFRVSTPAGEITARNVVVATGTNPTPRIPAFAAELPASVVQLHSSEYRNPGQVPDGEVLVVGCGTSGVEIALELARQRRTYVAGRPTPHVPDAVLRYAGAPYWWLLNNLLTVRTPIGRKARPGVQHGGAPLIRVSVQQLEQAGALRVPRVAAVEGGRPRLEDGRTLEVSAVVWATGYRPDFGWIDFPATQENGWLAGERGVSTTSPGLFFVGMPFQYALTSGLIGGVGRDADHVAAQIHDRAPARRAAA